MKTPWLQFLSLLSLCCFSLVGASPRAPSFTLYRVTSQDSRECLSPLCGGFFIQKVNSEDPPVYVAEIDVSGESSVVVENVNKYQAKYGSDLVLYSGRLVPYPKDKAGKAFNVSNLKVRDVHLGMPGVSSATALKKTVFYSVSHRGKGTFVREVNGNGSLVLVNGESSTFTVSPTAYTDVAWQRSQILFKGALISTKRVVAKTGGAVITVAEVFIRLPVSVGPCASQTAVCKVKRNERLVYKRNSNLCFQSRCTSRNDVCIQGFQDCADGYRIVSWPSPPGGCNAYSCDPFFVPLTPLPY